MVNAKTQDPCRFFVGTAGRAALSLSLLLTGASAWAQGTPKGNPAPETSDSLLRFLNPPFFDGNGNAAPVSATHPAARPAQNKPLAVKPNPPRTPSAPAPSKATSKPQSAVHKESAAPSINAARVSPTSSVPPSSQKPSGQGSASVHATVPPPAPPSKIENQKSNIESLTKPDVISAPAPAATGVPARTQDNPFAAIGDSGKMLLYLAPILLGILAALHLLRRVAARKGTLPGARSGSGYALASPARPARGLAGLFLGGFQRQRERPRGGNIRLVESVPVGSANLHLIEVRGRVLLVGATPAGVSLLTEFEEETLEAGDFRALLHAAASDMDSLDLDSPDIPTTAMVSTLEDAMRDTGDALRRGTRRLRTVQEIENENS